MKQATLPFAGAAAAASSLASLVDSPSSPPSTTTLVDNGAGADGQVVRDGWPDTLPPPPSIPPHSEPQPTQAPQPPASLPSAKSPSILHLLFRPRDLHPPSVSTAVVQENLDVPIDPTSSRPTRSSRAKAPSSYREDLKAVLRADAKLEASLCKQRSSPRLPSSQEHANPGAKGKRKRQRKAGAASVTSTPGADSPQLVQSGDDDDHIEIVSSSLAMTEGDAKDKEQATTTRERGREQKKGVEERLSLDVRGTPSASKPDAKPHPFFFQKRDKATQPPPAPPHVVEEVATSQGQQDKDKGKDRATKPKQPPQPLPLMRQEPPRWSLFAQKDGASAASSSSSSSSSSSAMGKGRKRVAVEVAWPSRDEMHVRNLWPDEEAAIQWAKEATKTAASEIPLLLTARQRHLTATGGKEDGDLPDVPLAGLIRWRAQGHMPQAGDAAEAQQEETVERHRPVATAAATVRQQIVLSAWTSSDKTLPPSFQHLLDHIDRRYRNGNDDGDDSNNKQRGRQQRLLTDTFRPHTASECLGNELNATYMRDWLRALLVTAPGSSSRPAAPSEGEDGGVKAKRRKLGDRTPAAATGARTVQKRVDKKRRRARRVGSNGEGDDGSEMADFIVDDSEEEEAWFDQFRSGGSDGSRHLRRGGNLSSSTTGEGMEEDTVAAAVFALQESTSLPPLACSAALSAASADGPTLAPLTFSASTNLTNCLVLSGPSGSGKTAAVYACASELGYEVFELYPGMGRRSGKDLHSAVGDLGRNHMVSSGGTGGGATWRHPTLSLGGVGANLKGEKVSDVELLPPPSTTHVRQSLIMVEEADLLYEDDKGFWTAIVELIAESRRPVIVTCNDAEMLPLSDLPVQEHLTFDLLDRHTAKTYLRLLAAASDRRVILKDADIEALWKEGRDVTASLAQQDAATVHEGLWEKWGETVRKEGKDEEGKWEKKVDLRQAIHQLEVMLTTFERDDGDATMMETPNAIVATDDESETTNDDMVSDIGTTKIDVLRLMSKQSETASFVHSLQWEEDFESYGQPPHLTMADQQIAPHMRQLYHTPLHDTPNRPTTFRYLPNMSSGIFDLSLIPFPTLDDWTLPIDLSSTSSHLSTLLSLLNIPLSSSHLPLSKILDYAPIVRNMSRYDDEQHDVYIATASALLESNAATGASSKGRNTRNSTRSLFSDGNADRRGEYIRWLPFGPEERRAASESALSF